MLFLTRFTLSQIKVKPKKLYMQNLFIFICICLKTLAQSELIQKVKKKESKLITEEGEIFDWLF